MRSWPWRPSDGAGRAASACWPRAACARRRAGSSPPANGRAARRRPELMAPSLPRPGRIGSPVSRRAPVRQRRRGTPTSDARPDVACRRAVPAGLDQPDRLDAERRERGVGATEPDAGDGAQARRRRWWSDQPDDQPEHQTAGDVDPERAPRVAAVAATLRRRQSTTNRATAPAAPASSISATVTGGHPVAERQPDGRQHQTADQGEQRRRPDGEPDMTVVEALRPSRPCTC